MKKAMMIIFFMSCCACVSGTQLMNDFYQTKLNNMDAQDFYQSAEVIEFIKAIDSNNNDKMNHFLSNGIDINAKGEECMTPLLWALAKQNIKSFRFLLEKGANPNWQCSFGLGGKRKISVIYLSSLIADSEYLSLAIKSGGDPNTFNKGTDRNAIFETVMYSRPGNLKVFIDNDADLNCRGADNNTPLITAASIKNFEIVYMLLDAGANPGLMNKWDYDLFRTVDTFGDRGIEKNSDRYEWYLKVLERLESMR